MNEAFAKVRRTNSLVHRILEAGGTLEDCIVGMDEYSSLMMKKLFELESIRPRKFRTQAGLFIWQCPVELIPEEIAATSKADSGSC